MLVREHWYTCGIKQPVSIVNLYYYLIGQLMINFWIMWHLHLIDNEVHAIK
jgi:hypothetical protein